MRKTWKIVGTALIGYTVISSSGYSIRQVDGRSMQPTFNPHLTRKTKRSHADSFGSSAAEYIDPLDWVLVSTKDRYKLRTGDIVTIYNPLVPTDRDIKRVVATSHQIVTTKGYKNHQVVVPKGHIWVEGDNHSLSKDSNSYGPIPAALVFGKALAIVFPPWRWQRLTRESSSNASLKASEPSKGDR